MSGRRVGAQSADREPRTGDGRRARVDRGPTPLGAGATLLATAVAGVALAAAVGVGLAAAVAAAGGACLAASVRLCGGRPTPSRTAAAAALLVAGGVGVVAGVGLATLGQVGALFPVPLVAMFVDPTLRVVGAAAVVAALAAATFGAAATQGAALRDDLLRRWRRLAARTAALPAAVAVVLSADSALAGGGGGGIAAVVGSIGGAAGGWAGPIAVVLGGAAVLVGVRALRRIARARATGLVRVLGPAAVGSVVAAGALLAHAPVLHGLVAFAVDRLPPALGDMVRQWVAGVIAYYGGGAVLLGLSAGVLGVVLGVALSLRAARLAGALPRRAAGPLVAGAGVFLASALSAPLGVPAPVALGGLVAGVLAWDAGAFASTLEREVGAAGAGRRVELVHLGGTLAVGAAGWAVALVGTWLLRSVPPRTGVPVSAALLAAAVGAVLLLVALR